jgi:hypothetical protein
MSKSDRTRWNLRALFLASAVLLAGVGPALAALTQADLATIASAVQSALAGAQPGAQADALQGVYQNLLGKFGSDNDQALKDAIIQDALADGASQQVVDSAFGKNRGGQNPPTIGGNNIPGGPTGGGSSSCTNPSCT